MTRPININQTLIMHVSTHYSCMHVLCLPLSDVSHVTHQHAHVHGYIHWLYTHHIEYTYSMCAHMHIISNLLVGNMTYTYMVVCDMQHKLQRCQQAMQDMPCKTRLCTRPKSNACEATRPTFEQMANRSRWSNATTLQGVSGPGGPSSEVGKNDRGVGGMSRPRGGRQEHESKVGGAAKKKR